MTVSRHELFEFKARCFVEMASRRSARFCLRPIISRYIYVVLTLSELAVATKQAAP